MKRIILLTCLWAMVLPCCQTKSILPDEELAKNAIENLLDDACHQKVEKFQWFTDKTLSKIIGNEDMDNKLVGNLLQEIMESPEEYAASLSQGMSELHSACHEKGLDWSDYDVESVTINLDDFDYINQTSISVYNGMAKIKSQDQSFYLLFKDLCIADNEGRYLTVTGFEPATHLDQTGSFEEFFKSLALCFAQELPEEIDKIVLVNDEGKKVIEDESMVPSEYIDSFKQVFLSAVQNEGYEADEANYALAVAWGLADDYGLDEDEIMNNCIVYEVPGGLNGEKVLSGWYYKYKGKWYLWSMN